ncbi:hypothetical protein TIFTF001_042672 [Ficus carica]|uniref:Uncharacterized protein n=1 Tax=Ficus carica TaxID=3494 RepID=A0AA87ZQ76_FICCA|nr:hypothetical protein TIFTF001_042672 [Ficus carica]
MVRGLYAKKDVEPSVYQENMPTVDQYNSFKTSCTLHDKQPGVLICQPCRLRVRSISSLLSTNFRVDSCLLRLEGHGWRAFPPIQSMGCH